MKIMTSTVNLETQVKEVLGIVGAQYVVAINVAKDITVVFKDITGGRISGYEAEINEARQTCCNEMSESAQKKAQTQFSVFHSNSVASAKGVSLSYLAQEQPLNFKKSLDYLEDHLDFADCNLTVLPKNSYYETMLDG
ncbi:hypothetical protein A4R64_00675 [Corynebacterium pseudotuberculosis]|nr:heavy metal-binding domain-containing protein [Corynebacterium pseudotuberculosis]APB22363.1 hypothetical protein A4R64_00675 [Corynebacterium pseudotuberculosis]